MATNVLMPQLGESIAEGTIVRWNKRVGERVDRPVDADELVRRFQRIEIAANRLVAHPCLLPIDPAPRCR